jgi:hypothetical protein
MNKHLGILTSAENKRKSDLVTNVLHWCKQRSIPHRLLPEGELIERGILEQIGAL